MLGGGSDKLGKFRKGTKHRTLNIIEHQIYGLAAFSFNVEHWVFGVLA
jgi:hypothetical protein